MQRGLFPCSPLAPTLAVDLQVLEFVTCLFVHIPPNNTGWCKTVEEFLDSQGYKLTTKVSSFIEYDVTLLKYIMQDSLRRRFGSALQWYHALQDATNKHVDNILTHVRRITVGIDDGLLKDATPDSDFPTPTSPTPMRMAPIAISNPDPHTTDDETHDHEFSFCSRAPSVTPELQDRSPETSPAPSAPSPSKRRRSEVDLDDNDPSDTPINPFPDPAPRSRPSDYLHSRCPICFGGEFPRISLTG
jgi:hypothetical protein